MTTGGPLIAIKLRGMGNLPDVYPEGEDRANREGGGGMALSSDRGGAGGLTGCAGGYLRFDKHIQKRAVGYARNEGTHVFAAFERWQRGAIRIMTGRENSITAFAGCAGFLHGLFAGGDAARDGRIGMRFSRHAGLL